MHILYEEEKNHLNYIPRLCHAILILRTKLHINKHCKGAGIS